MLAQFTIKAHFSGLDVSIFVDCVRKEAEALINYNRRIVRQEFLPFWEVMTPEKADAWLKRPMGELGNMTEYLHWHAARGMLAQAEC